MNRNTARPQLRRSLWASALLLAGVVVLAACSSPAHPAAASGAASSNSAQSGASPSSTMPSDMASMSPSGGASNDAASSSAASGNSAPVAGNAVTIKNFAFAPAALTVKVGTKVTWTNQDSDAHTVTSQDNGGPLSSAALSTGQSYSYTFTKPGTYSYLCTIHPFMTATVTVTP